LKHPKVLFCCRLPLSDSMSEVHRITSSGVAHNLLRVQMYQCIYNNIYWTDLQNMLSYHLVVVRSMWYHIQKKRYVCVSLINFCMQQSLLQYQLLSFCLFSGIINITSWNSCLSGYSLCLELNINIYEYKLFMFTEQIAISSVFTIIKYGIELPSWDGLKTNIMCTTEPS